MDLPDVFGWAAQLHLIVWVVLKEAPYEGQDANIVPGKYTLHTPSLILYELLLNPFATGRLLKCAKWYWR